jgi:hypothetical protein
MGIQYRLEMLARKLQHLKANLASILPSRKLELVLREAVIKGTEILRQ